MALDVGLVLAVVILLDLGALALVTLMEFSAGRTFVLLWEEESPLTPLLTGSLVVLAAAVLSLIEISLPGPSAIRLNLGGVLVPLGVTGLLLVLVRPRGVHVAATVLLGIGIALGFVFVEGTRFEISVVGFFVLVGAVTVFASWVTGWHLVPGAALAYAAAVLGTFVGVDLVGLASLPGGQPVDVSLGAEGILDLVFLAGLVAVALVWCATTLARLTMDLRRRRAAPTQAS